MPKIKTNSAAKKRFKVTGSGKIKRAHANHRHLLRRKDSQQKGESVKTTVVSVRDTPRVKTMLGMGSNH